jgi:hypothetical protein
MQSGSDRTRCVEESYEPCFTRADYGLNDDWQFIPSCGGQIIVLDPTFDVIDFIATIPAYG